MANTVMGKNRRVKKTVRKTLGALFMVSAITVAAIPVDGLQAAEGDLKVTVDMNNCSIPNVNVSETILTSNGIFS